MTCEEKTLPYQNLSLNSAFSVRNFQETISLASTFIHDVNKRYQ